MAAISPTKVRMSSVSPKSNFAGSPEALKASVLQASELIGGLPNFSSPGEPRDRNNLQLLISKDLGGYQPIHYAAASGDTHLLKLLLEIFACFPSSFVSCVSAEDPSGNSPLHFAAERGHSEAVALLVDSGAHINQVNQKGLTSLHIAASLVADSPTHDEIVKFLLSNGADPTIADITGTTCLHTACSIGNEKLVDLLIENGALINAVDEEQETPLFSAVRGQHVSVIKKLWERGATLTSNSDGETVLDTAAEVEDLEILELLKSLKSLRPSKAITV